MSSSDDSKPTLTFGTPGWVGHVDQMAAATYNMAQIPAAYYRGLKNHAPGMAEETALRLTLVHTLVPQIPGILTGIITSLEASGKLGAASHPEAAEAMRRALDEIKRQMGKG